MTHAAQSSWRIMTRASQLQPLEPHQVRDFWPVCWASVLASGLLIALFGQTNDWLRWLVFGFAVAVGHSLSRERPVIALLGFVLFGMVFFTWMYLDPSGIMQRHNATSMYSFLMISAVLAASIYCGLGGAMIGLVSSAPLLTFSQIPQGTILVFQLLGGGSIGVLIHHLILDLQRTRNQLESVVMIDVLTGLENRRALPIGFERQQAYALRESKALMVTLWDLNDLKRINDSQGHAAGDAYLQAFADVLRLETRPYDLFYRTGGDEFVGLHLGLSDGAVVRDRVQARFPNVAVGWSPMLEDLEATLHVADQMMYAAKKAQKALEQV